MKKKEQKVPFFANLLEKQIASETVIGGDKGKKAAANDDKRPLPTMKWPSDADEPTFEPEFQGW